MTSMARLSRVLIWTQADDAAVRRRGQPCGVRPATHDGSGACAGWVGPGRPAPALGPAHPYSGRHGPAGECSISRNMVRQSPSSREPC